MTPGISELASTTVGLCGLHDNLDVGHDQPGILREMKILRSLTRRMVVKIFFAIALGVGGALALFAWKQSTSQVNALNENTRLSAGQLADLVVGSVEHSMLEGK